MSPIPITSNRRKAEGQYFGDECGAGNDYLEGFLDGVAAASTTRGMVFDSPVLPLPNEAIGQLTAWPILGLKSSNANCGVNQYFSRDDWLPLETGENPGLQDIGDHFKTRSFLDPWNPRSGSARALADSQPIGPALEDSEIFVNRSSTSPEALLHNSTTNSGELGNEMNAFTFPATGIGGLAQHWKQSRGIRAFRNDNLKGPPSFATRGSESSNASVDLPLAVSTKGVVSAAPETVFRVYGTKRSRFSEKSRTSTALTRKRGACDACKKKKIRCEQAEEEFAPCKTCASTSMRLLYAPCCRIEIIDIKPFRFGTTLDPHATVQHWMKSKEPGKGTILLQDGSKAFEAPRRVQLTHDICTTTFEVTLSRYQPAPSDTTGYVMTDATGCKQKYELPPYYISDLTEASRNLSDYIHKARREFSMPRLISSNPVIQKTFKEAERYYAVSGSELVAAALMFWSATRMIERTWLITGNDLLGLPPMKQKIGPNRYNPRIKAIPVTPIMDTQLDEISIKHVLIPLKTKLLRRLKKKVLEKKKENWYEIFLATFIILHNLEEVIGQVMDYSRRSGISFSPRSNDESSLSHAYYHACKTMLAYFHFASGGSAPLSLDWVGPAPDTSIMSHQQFEYLCDIKEECLSQATKLESLKGESMYETEMYWCHQLLLRDWKADMPHSGPFLACTEKDFLFS